MGVALRENDESALTAFSDDLFQLLRAEGFDCAA